MSRLKLVGVFTCASCGHFTFGEPIETGAFMECVRCGVGCDNEFDHAYLAHIDQKWDDYDELPVTCEPCKGEIDDFHIKSLEEQFEYLMPNSEDSYIYKAVCQQCQQRNASNVIDASDRFGSGLPE